MLYVNACNKVCKSIPVTQKDRQKWETKVDLIIMLYHLGFKTNFYYAKNAIEHICVTLIKLEVQIL